MPGPQQGQVNVELNSYGGYQTASIYSGLPAGPNLTAAPGAINTGADVCLFSGNGRLCLFTPHTNMLSGGTAIFFYDATILTSGGPFVASGHKVIFVYPSTLATASGTAVPQVFTPVSVQMPFQSGLAFRSASGQPGFTVSWTIEPAGRQ